MLNIVAPLIAGILVGFLLRDKRRIDLGKITFSAIIILIFSMGFTIGSNNELLTSMTKIGANALVILLLTVLFSLLFAEVARKMVKLQ